MQRGQCPVGIIAHSSTYACGFYQFKEFLDCWSFALYALSSSSCKISGRKMSWLSWDTKIAKHYFLKLKMFKLNIQMLSSIESHDIKKLQLKIFCRVSIIHIHTYEWTATSTLHAFSSGCKNEVLKNLMDFSRDVLSQSVTQRVEQRGCLRQGCMVLKCYIFLAITNHGKWCLSLTIFRICLKTSSIELS